MSKSNNSLFQNVEDIAFKTQDIEEVIELIEESRSLFQHKLALLKQQALIEQDPKQVKKLLGEAENLYQQYLHTLKTIENYMEVL